LILKASERGGGKQLALHLLNQRDNEHVEVHDIRGFIAGDLIGAMKEAYAVSKGTRCQKHLFSVSLNPPATEKVGIDVFEKAIEKIELKNGLTGHPRVIVFHEKEGRRHAHAVWSRIDVETMTAKNLSHYKNKLRDIAKETYLENDWALPAGFIDSKAHDPRNYSLAEYQQAKRMGQDARDLKAMMQECWTASDSASAFKHALSERGITLAKGDRRGHVAVTHEGEVLAISRYTGKKAKEVRSKLGEPENLPSVEEAKIAAAGAMNGALARHIVEAKQQRRMALAPLEDHRQHMTNYHQAERARLDAGQKIRWEQEARLRSERLNKGLRGLWDRFSGYHAETERRNIAEAQTALSRDRDQHQELITAQLTERRRLQVEIKTVRDQQAELLRNLRSDQQAYRTKPPEKQPDRVAPRIEPQFRQVAKVNERKEPSKLTKTFERQVQPEPASPPLQDRLQRLRENRTPVSRHQDREREP